MGLPDFTMLSNRLRKVAKHYDRWAKKQGIECYRLYDADIPEFPLAIDRYAEFLHVAEYERNHPLSDEEYRLWKSGCKLHIAEALELPAAQLYFKERRRQKGLEQYEKVDGQKSEVQVTENGLTFLVNLSDYLDTGLFLDHRNTRSMVRDQVKGLRDRVSLLENDNAGTSAEIRVLNLFAYTGSFSVYAAAGGASHTTTIDLSNTYLDWAKKNMELNGFTGKNHQFVRADVLQWLQEAPGKPVYDVIVLDPPTFSNSKRMEGVLDVQRDHTTMISHCLRLLAKDGVLYFSTNFRKFKLDEANIRAGSIQDISHLSVPEDFRNKKIHYCFKITK